MYMLYLCEHDFDTIFLLARRWMFTQKQTSNVQRMVLPMKIPQKTATTHHDLEFCVYVYMYIDICIYVNK